MSDYERVALVKSEVFVYKIPPLGSNRGHRAAEWKLDAPDWTGRLRLVALGPKLEIRLEDRGSGELFAKAPVDKYPGPAVESVNDSSRYFVVRLVNDNGQSANIGIGFADRGDSFDMNVALQDHFKYVDQEARQEKDNAEEAQRPKLDLGFKEGQTIKINIAGRSEKASPRPRPSGASSSGGPVPLLPPPPAGGSRIAPPPSGGAKRGIPAPPSSSNLPAQDTAKLADDFASLAAPSKAPQASSTSKPAGSALDDLLGL